METLYANLSVAEKPGSKVEIKGELTAAAVAKRRADAVKRLNENVSLDGFRKGHIPEKILAERLGEAAILHEAATLAMEDAYRGILAAENIDAIGRPSITITKLVPGEPVAFTIETAVLPPVNLPDYRSIARGVPSPAEEPIAEKEIEAFVGELRRIRAQKEKLPKEPEGPLTDEEVKLMGPFESAAAFIGAARAHLEEEKRRKRKEKRRVAILEALAAATPLEIPALLVEAELDRMEARFAADLKRMGLTAEGYLSTIGKKSESVRDEWRKDALKRAKMELILEAIARKENIAAENDAVERELEHLKEHDPALPHERARAAIAAMLVNERVLAFLEGAETDTAANV